MLRRRYGPTLTVEKDKGPITKQPPLGDRHLFKQFTLHRFDRIAPDLIDQPYARR
jgi:hypothetical protein